MTAGGQIAFCALSMCYRDYFDGHFRLINPKGNISQGTSVLTPRVQFDPPRPNH